MLSRRKRRTAQRKTVDHAAARHAHCGKCPRRRSAGEETPSESTPLPSARRPAAKKSRAGSGFKAEEGVRRGETSGGLARTIHEAHCARRYRQHAELRLRSACCKSRASGRDFDVARDASASLARPLMFIVSARRRHVGFVCGFVASE